MRSVVMPPPPREPPTPLNPSKVTGSASVPMVRILAAAGALWVVPCVEAFDAVPAQPVRVTAAAIRTGSQESSRFIATPQALPSQPRRDPAHPPRTSHIVIGWPLGRSQRLARTFARKTHPSRTTFSSGLCCPQPAVKPDHAATRRASDEANHD